MYHSFVVHVFACWSNHVTIVKPESHMSDICDVRPKVVAITVVFDSAKHVWLLEIIISKESSFFNVTVWNVSSNGYKTSLSSTAMGKQRL